MRKTYEVWSTKDLRFIVDTLVPERSDPEHVVQLLHEDEPLLEAMLQDDRLFRQLMSDETVQLTVSPELFFKVLLRRTRRDLAEELYTIERRNLQKVVLFDANQVVDLLDQPGVCDYLATMLASFTRINSATIPIRIRPGIWRRYRVNDLDVDSLLHYAQIIEEENRFGIYKRIADACLFLTGIFPEFIDAQQRYSHSDLPRSRLRSSTIHNLEDHEVYGRTFYRLAGKHKMASAQAQNHLLLLLSEQFVLAEKPLVFLTQRYLSMRKHQIFEL
jgi:hypothetical protein